MESPSGTYPFPKQELNPCMVWYSTWYSITNQLYTQTFKVTLNELTNSKIWKVIFNKNFLKNQGKGGEGIQRVEHLAVCHLCRKFIYFLVVLKYQVSFPGCSVFFSFFLLQSQVSNLTQETWRKLKQQLGSGVDGPKPNSRASLLSTVEIIFPYPEDI